jgi:ABC-2 type transport system ATP-binding protein
MAVRTLPDRPQPDADSPSVEGQDRELFAMHCIKKSWKSRGVLDEVELVLDAGTLTSISGTNGIGKTTLLRIAAGLITPDSGVVDLEGLHPRRDRSKYQARVGFLSANDRGLYARLTVGQHLELWGRISMLGPDRFQSSIERTVDCFGLADLAESRVDRISMGQRQRVRLAMTFLHQPDLVLLDEPLNSLDEHGAALLRACLTEVTARGGAALWCSPAPPREAQFDVMLQLEGGTLKERPPN